MMKQVRYFITTDQLRYVCQAASRGQLWNMCTRIKKGHPPRARWTRGPLALKDSVTHGWIFRQNMWNVLVMRQSIDRRLFHFVLQKLRFANLAKFKASVYKIMVATDVAARSEASFHMNTLHSPMAPQWRVMECVFFDFLTFWPSCFGLTGVWISQLFRLSSTTTPPDCPRPTSTGSDGRREQVRTYSVSVSAFKVTRHVLVRVRFTGCH